MVIELVEILVIEPVEICADDWAFSPLAETRYVTSLPSKTVISLSAVKRYVLSISSIILL
jgi:hypothetical protein